MGKLWVSAAIVLLFSFSPCWAQNKLVKSAVKSPASISRAVERSLLKSVPRPVLNKYGRELWALAEGNRLPARLYPKLSRHNDLLLEKALTQFVEQEKAFSANAPEIVGNIQSAVYHRVPYAKFLPKDVDVLYIGEIHQEPRVQAEIKNLVLSLRDIYPDRKIYLAAESVSAAFDGSYAMDDLLLSRTDLSARLRETEELLNLGHLYLEEIASFSVVRAALDAKIPVLGMESDVFLLRLSTPKGRWFPTAEQYEQIICSLVGMQSRNRRFAKAVTMLRKADPSALVVVYGGIDHFAYHQPDALATLVGGKSFVIQVTVPNALPASNPLFKNIRESADIRRRFNASPDAKLVESWGKPTPFNQILGNDLTIIVHEEP